MQWNPVPGDDFFVAFPGHRQQRSLGSPYLGAREAGAWSPIRENPPAWVQPRPPSWVNDPANPHPQPQNPSWNAPSPFRNPQLELGNNSDPWALGWGTSTPFAIRPSESASGQPVSAGFFNANASPNGMARSISERPPTLGAPAPWPSQPNSPPGWDIPRPKSAMAPGRPLTRSLSTRIGLPAYLIPDTWDETNLARRPRDWRASYNPRASFLSNLSVLPSALKNQSDVQEYADPTKRRFTPSLEYHATQPPVSHDIRCDPFGPVNPIFHTRTSSNDHRSPFNELDMAQFATTPSAHFLRLVHPKLPWYIDIQQSQPNGVTVGDILTQLYAQLEQPILPRHYWNDVLSEQDRKDIGKAYQRRIDLWKSDAERGILWIDFLCGEIIFEGFARVKGGLWEIKTRNAYL